MLPAFVKNQRTRGRETRVWRKKRRREKKRGCFPLAQSARERVREEEKKKEKREGEGERAVLLSQP